MTTLDADMASFVHAKMRAHGIDLRLGKTVEGFSQKGDSVQTLLQNGESLRSDMVLLAIGVTPDIHLAKDAGIKLGVRGSIVVNERMETSIPNIYAVGDAVEVTHFVTGQKVLISLAGPANKQGRIVADNICGGNNHFSGSQGSSVLKLFDLTAASTGINERTAQTAGEYKRGHLGGFQNIPLDNLREHLEDLDRSKPVYVNCQVGLRGYLACRILTQYGFTCFNLSGGYKFYQAVKQENEIVQSAYPCGIEKI